ncbi:hypothetical protein PT974_08721 [Cladobotryum mycophilum]|uniref:Fibroin-3 related protein n=1 Tax=Cladobotryum mycophilum TaxID=491253 RepID=A0ABR0SE57_9HYPO
MPAIDIAMARSVNGGVWGTMKTSLVNSLAAEVIRRDMVTDAKDKASEIKHTFTNWNLCMTKAYCKWPAIGVIIVLSLLIIAISICIVRCCWGRPHKYSDEPFNNQQQGYGYRGQAPMEVHFPPPPTTAHSTHTPAAGPPQYAEFDMKKANPDDLPAMPSWEESNSKKIMVEEEVEMEDLKKKEPPTMQRMPPKRGPMPGNPNAMPRSPSNAYSPMQNTPTGYMNAHAQQPANGYGGGGLAQPYDYDSKRTSDGFGLDQPYDAPPPLVTANLGHGRQSPAPVQNGYGGRQLVQGQTRMQSPVHELDGQERFQLDSTPVPYGMDPHMRNSPGPQNEYGAVQPRYDSPGPGQNARASPHPQNEYSLAGHDSRQSPISQHAEYSHVPARFDSPAPPSPFGNTPSRVNSPKLVPYRSYTPKPQNGQAPITNNGGFDFNSGYARPQNGDDPDTPEAYPGYKPYTPTTPTQPTWHGI